MRWSVFDVFNRMVWRRVDGVLDVLVTVWRWCCGVCKNMWHNESRHVSRQRPESRLGTGSTTCLIHSIDWLSKSKNHLRTKIPPVQSSRDKWRSMWSVLFPISGNRFCASAFLTSTGWHILQVRGSRMFVCACLRIAARFGDWKICFYSLGAVCKEALVPCVSALSRKTLVVFIGCESWYLLTKRPLIEIALEIWMKQIKNVNWIK